MTERPFQYGLVVAAVLFAAGLTVVLARRNLIFMLLGVEIMFNAAGLAFVTAGARWGTPDGQVMLIFLLTVSAAEVAVGLALILLLFTRQKEIDADLMAGLFRRRDIGQASPQGKESP